MPLYLGIDAGGTKTEAALSNGAELLGQVVCGSAKISRVGEYEARSHLLQAIRESCEAGKVSPRAIERVCIGIAGASMTNVAAWTERVIQELIPGDIRVIGDHVIAHRAAFGSLPGVLVIAGTGSIAYGRNEAGETARAGGWGPAVSDEGSAFWIGREAVSAALREHDLAMNNGLLATITRCWNAASPEEVVRIANGNPGANFAGLASAVVALAENGDQGAQAIVERAGAQLAALSGRVITRLWPPDAVVRVAMAGGVLQGSNLIRRAFQQAIAGKYPKVALSFAYVRPVLGALAFAAQPGALK